MNSKLTTRLGLEQRDEPYSPFRKAFGITLVAATSVAVAIDGVLLASWYTALAFGGALLMGLFAVVLLAFDLTINTGNEN